MAAVTVEGIYENGRVTLTERPQGVKRARVKVTFLSDAEGDAEQEEIAVPSAPSTSVVGEERYPAELRDEYQALILKKLHRALTESDAMRLKAVREEVNRRDRKSASWSLREDRAREVEQQMIALRQELEALPDA